MPSGRRKWSLSQHSRIAELRPAAALWSRCHAPTFGVSSCNPVVKRITTPKPPHSPCTHRSPLNIRAIDRLLLNLVNRTAQRWLHAVLGLHKRCVFVVILMIALHPNTRKDATFSGCVTEDLCFLLTWPPRCVLNRRHNILSGCINVWVLIVCVFFFNEFIELVSYGFSLYPFLMLLASPKYSGFVAAPLVWRFRIFEQAIRPCSALLGPNWDPMQSCPRQHQIRQFVGAETLRSRTQ